MPGGERGGVGACYDALYKNNPTYHGETERMTEPPPVRRLYNIYGTNIKTEKLYFYKEDSAGEYTLTTQQIDVPHHKFINGIAYETKRTPQHFLSQTRHDKRSGDGTVPFESLAYPDFHWASQIEVFKSIELEEFEYV